MTREQLSFTYMNGSGIEIGALHNPWPIANGAKVVYLDRYDKGELMKQYPELDASKIVKTDVLADGFSLPMNAAYFDFLCASHVLEHCEDPIGVLFGWGRVLKPGGVIFLAIPEKTQTFDRKRPVTTFEHLVADHQSPNFRAWYKMKHYYEFHRNKDFPDRPALYGDALDAAVRADMDSDAHIHFHTWTTASLRDFLKWTCEIFPGFLSLEFFSFQEFECLAVLRVL